MSSNGKSGESDRAGKGYLYHRQTTGHGDPSSGKNRHQEGLRRISQPATAKRVFPTNLRVFLFVVVCMIGVLQLALYYSRRNWELKQVKATTPGPQSSSMDVADRNPRKNVHEEGSPEGDSGQGETDGRMARKAVILARKGTAAENAGNYEEAVKKYREALDIWPHLTPVWAQLGRAYIQLKDYPRAQGALQRAVEMDPNSVKALNDLGAAHLYQNRNEKALDCFEKALKIDSTYEDSLYNRALCYMALSSRTNAMAAFEQYLQAVPDEPRALKETAFLLAGEGLYDQALEKLEVAMKKLPDWPGLYFDAAAAAMLANRTDEAFSYLERAEVLTSARIVYQVYREPAFKQVRDTERGKAFEQNLTERAKQPPPAGAAKKATWVNSRAPQVSASISLIPPSSTVTSD